MKNSFFTREREFYSSFFRMFLLIAMQNIITYSVNMADNVMLGSYDQTALAAAAAVNQIQYVLQQLTVAGLGEGLVIISGQYWGSGDHKTAACLAGIALRWGLGIGVVLTLVAAFAPEQMVRLFTDDAAVVGQAVSYLKIMRWSYVIFIASAMLMASLRAVQVVGIAFRISCVTLVVNICINYVLIFGRFGAPAMGIQGAAVGTLTARCLELVLVLLYIRRADVPVRNHVKELLKLDKALSRQFVKVSAPCAASAILFSVAVSVQTAIFGRISVDAMAAVSMTATVYQYCKMIPISAASASGVLIAKCVGSGQKEKLRPYVHTLQCIFAGVGVVTGLILLVLREPLLGVYALSDTARVYARQILIIQIFIAMGMSYQMPCQLGIIRPGGDPCYSMISDIIYSWVLTVPLGLLSAFVFRWPVAAVFFCLNVDQLLKCITVSYKVNRYTWIKELAAKR